MIQDGQTMILSLDPPHSTTTDKFHLFMQDFWFVNFRGVNRAEDTTVAGYGKLRTVQDIKNVKLTLINYRRKATFFCYIIWIVPKIAVILHLNKGRAHTRHYLPHTRQR